SAAIPIREPARSANFTSGDHSQGAAITGPSSAASITSVRPPIREPASAACRAIWPRRTSVEPGGRVSLLRHEQRSPCVICRYETPGTNRMAGDLGDTTDDWEGELLAPLAAQWWPPAALRPEQRLLRAVLEAALAELAAGRMAVASPVDNQRRREVP